MSNSPILYSFRRCPYAMRARWAIWHCQLSVEIREVVLRDKPQELWAVSPKGTVPALCLPDGKVMTESLEIMLWALGQDHAWHPSDLAAEQMALILQHDSEFKPLLDAYKYPERHLALSHQQHQENAMYWLETNLCKRLAVHTYLIDAEFHLSDAAIAPFIRQFAAVDRAWFVEHANPLLQQWLARVLQDDFFAAGMQKYPRWQAGDTPSYFPAQL
ncbi:glutathione S-transferase N-terminal domain-containing protein [Deefgea piscis]|uniref:glutathione S-transferase N-terminal domain-containing protein n=1 Tax=Deefgea piscis TaxID=2739061 RepID=UPI001C805CF0|nr:glutathione S-transferase N-terminal domain-containing protein [Deefgea piscis]QZA82226.1 glutathione S-transferase N-terminal domain-containing protein [Deefgea piscis]